MKIRGAAAIGEVFGRLIARQGYGPLPRLRGAPRAQLLIILKGARRIEPVPMERSLAA